MQKWRSLVETAKHQIYISKVNDPFLNLSIEHFLLQKSPSHSTLLFLYINRKCAVIGRNQNPWLEVNLPYLQANNGDLVRRRSGGGAVFHDEGNVNYSVICPSADFTRDKHAEMVTRAIRSSDHRVRVNERHDIVLDRGPRLPRSERPSPYDLHRTKYAEDERKTLKVSGSAYKMIRNRCLHHGTCLVASPNIHILGDYLRSPARGFIKARGVDSVRSPVGNIFADLDPPRSEGIAFNTDRIQSDIVREFTSMYGVDVQFMNGKFWKQDPPTPALCREHDLAVGFVGAETMDVPEVAKGVEELKSPKWVYGQTPEFTLSGQVHSEDNQSEGLSTPLPQTTNIYLKARGGAITETSLTSSLDVDLSIEQTLFDGALRGRHIHEVENFLDIPFERHHPQERNLSNAMAWLNKMFGKEERPIQKSLL